MEYTTIVSELEDLLERMETTIKEYEPDGWWIYESERKALITAIDIVRDLIEDEVIENN